MADKPRFWSDAKVEPKRSFRWDFLLSGDNEQIETILSQSRNLYQMIGDCGDEYR